MGTLAQVIAAAAAFVGTHLAMSHPLRAPLVSRVGEQRFLGLYSLVSFATLGWLIWAMRRMGPEEFLWAAPEWAWLAASIIMLIASILLVGSLIGNPALPGVPPRAREPRGVFAITRHPMMWGFALWSAAHALVWPQPSVLVLCLAIALLALVGAAGQDAKKSRLQPDFWPEWRRKTGYVPFTGPTPVRAMWPGWGVLLGGVALWLLATWLHPLLSAPPVGVWS
ncbi:MFS transporter [Sphingomonas sp. ID1715]|uniref:NnrU family protein n=1 Tax=Sphingomonas sp. ID1715 TaxID=1656898 RepID=UPI001487BC1D|nr:NnrU family protein [Sphingomonas sp. ID1715]NNM75612.1 MFS transporter [Sphingomonas sp. ID1715]